MNRLAIFDCDGTIVDSQRNICLAMERCFAEAGLPLPEPHRTRLVVGLSLIEAMGAMQADEAMVRGLARLLDDIKGNAGALSLSGLADTAGLMGTMARRGGGLQVKVRGLRELLGSLKINYEAALRQATTPEGPAADE